jgi:hypothetical protein
LHFEPRTGISTLLVLTSPIEGEAMTSSAIDSKTDIAFEKLKIMLWELAAIK